MTQAVEYLLYKHEALTSNTRPQINGLKTQSLTKLILKHNPAICCTQNIISNITKVKRYKNIYHKNLNQRKTELARLVSGKVTLETKKMTSDGH
jgi:hypothetical protein